MSIRDPRNEDSVGLEPTTGGPVDFSWRPEGCVCYIREDVEYGDVITRPPGGCPVHRPRTLDEIMAEVAQQVTEDFLWPNLTELGIEDPTRYRVAVDRTPLSMTPLRDGEAL